MKKDVYALHNRVGGITFLHDLERGKGIREEEEFMRRGREREVRKAAIDGK